MQQAKKYRKRSVVIEAIQWTGNNSKEIVDFAGKRIQIIGENPVLLHIDTLEGLMRAGKGDFIIKGLKNEFYPCKPDIFKMTYDEFGDEISVLRKERAELTKHLEIYKERVMHFGLMIKDIDEKMLKDITRCPK